MHDLFGLELYIDSSHRWNGIINFAGSMSNLSCLCFVSRCRCFDCRSEVRITNRHNDRELGVRIEVVAAQ